MRLFLWPFEKPNHHVSRNFDLIRLLFSSNRKLHDLIEIISQAMSSDQKNQHHAK